MRVKTGTTRRAAHKKILKKAKGYIGRRKSVFKLAKQAVIKAGRYAYRDRKTKKRSMRGLWIIRLNAAAREHGLSYSELINKLAKSNIMINRKLLSEMAASDPKAFEAIIAKVK
jgi:large subunit ribosomal protein L20